MGVFGDLFSNAPARDAARIGNATRQAGLEQTTGTLQGGYGDAAKFLGEGSARFDPLAQTAGQGFQSYANLFGIGGGDPTAAVRAMPGYQFSQNEATEAVKRNAASTGALASSNTLQNISDTTANRGLAQWQQYAQGLLPFMQLAPQIAAQQGGFSMGQAGLETGLADKLSQYQMGVSSANADALSSAELARAAAAKNVFDAVMGVGKLAVGAFTGVPLGGGMSGPSPAGNFMNMFK